MAIPISYSNSKHTMSASNYCYNKITQTLFMGHSSERNQHSMVSAYSKISKNQTF